MEQSSGGHVLPEASPLPPKKKRGRPRKSDSAATTPASGEKVRKNKESKKHIAAAAEGEITPNTPFQAFSNDVYNNNEDDNSPSVPSKPLVGHEVHGVVDGLFDSGYLITIRVNNTDIVFRGVVFGPGLPVDGEDANNFVSETKKRKKMAVEKTEEEEEDDDDEEAEEKDENGAGSVVGDHGGAYRYSAPHSYSDITGFEQKEVPSVSGNVQTMHHGNTEASPASAPPAAYRSSFIDPEMMKFMYPGGLPEQMQYPSNFYPFHPAGATAEIGIQQPPSASMPPPHST